MIIFKLIYSHLGYENIIFELVVIIYLFDFLINNYYIDKKCGSYTYFIIIFEERAIHFNLTKV